ncbi:MAG: efflux RND transporter periplasmic adaptor subunit [Candidatus Aminicenantes bacterium]|nr:MAG: efflux RND transporter periplasmic adaptor subunit [Candidatus Aminicenantes bacterium]
MKKKIIIPIIILLILAVTIIVLSGGKKKNEELKYIPVERGNISEKALAVGTLEPEQEIKVKSTISGIVSEVLFKVGDSVTKDSPLFNILPNPTPLEYVETRRNMEVAEVTLTKIQSELDRKTQLFQSSLISQSDMEAVEAQYNEARLRHRVAKEKFELLEKGRIQMANLNIDSIIKAPISGIMLSLNSHEGDPVVPLTNFQPGTELCSMADMRDILFKGTVDEIDVGKLVPGMEAEIQIGALAEKKIRGTLQRIFPKARKEGNATLFDVEILLGETPGIILRAGYSATAYVKIQEHKGVLIVPERLILSEAERRYVEVKQGEIINEVDVKTGLSDGLNIEILEGLEEGDLIVERPPREIE